MGVSPWNTNPNRVISPEGTIGNPTHRTHVAPSGLPDRFNHPIHGFAPVATACRPSGTKLLTLGRYVGADKVTATKWRQAVAMGISPWKWKPTLSIGPEGTTERSKS